MFSFNMKKFLKWPVEADTASLQQAKVVLKTKAESRRSRKFGTSFAATDDTLLCEAENEQICQLLRPSTALQTYAASSACVAEWFLYSPARRFSPYFC